jgi:hypothetical protein
MREYFKRLNMTPAEYLKDLYENKPVFDEFPINFNLPETNWVLIASHILSQDEFEHKRFLKYVENA